MRVYLWLFLFLVACSQKDLNKVIPKEQPPKVLAVYPTIDSLPENLLRFYVQFSQSMKAVNNLENIKLLDEQGKEIKGAIFNNVYELWDSEQKQLTLILDPARVKTGLVAHENLGRALVSGHHFQLLIEKAEDIYGNPLTQPFVKNFFVTKADKEIPNPTNWRFTLPNSNSKTPLKINFPQILDRLSLLNSIRLLDANKKKIKGSMEVTNQERIWRFVPEKPWIKGIYTLQINSRLEDPAGNNINGLFDHKIGSLKSQREGVIITREISIN